MSEYEASGEVGEPVVVEHVTVVEEPSPAGEMLRFFALVIVLGVVVLVVAAVRPLIFGRIVPAVMGEGIVVPTTEPPAIGGEEEADTPEASPDEGEPASEVTTPEENTTAGDAESSPSAGEEMAGEGEAEVQEETTNEGNAGETATTTTHTIQQGETLQSIAAQYGLTLQELIAANNLPNPDYIRIGDKLVIPQAAGE